MGALRENFFISERIKYNHYNQHHCNTYFWRTREQQEIDHIEECDCVMTAFEMKCNTRKASTRFPKSFLENYPVRETVVVTQRTILNGCTN